MLCFFAVDFFPIGNQRLYESLLKKAHEKNFPHALLLSGPKDIGKFLMAKGFAKELLNDEKVFRNTHPSCMCIDRLWVARQDENLDELSKSSTFDQFHRKKEKKTTDTIGIEDLEVFTKFLHETTPYEYKVCLIRDIERMRHETSNHFLKLLEEPPAKTIFIMTTSNFPQLMETIVSRCQIISIPSPSSSDISSFLSVKNISSQDMQDILFFAGDKAEIARKLSGDRDLLSQVRQQKNHVEEMLESNPLKKISLAESWAKLTSQELDVLFSILEKILRIQLQEEMQFGRGEKKVEQIEALLFAWSALKKNVNKRLTLDSLFMQL